MELDEIEGGILGMLEQDAKTRIHEIARKLRVPPSTVHHRIKRMEQEGVIAGWTIVKGFQKLGLTTKAHVLVSVDVTALKRMRKTQEDIARELKKTANVERVDIIAGEADLLVTLRCHGMEEFRKTLLEKIQMVDGITNTKTMMVIAET